METFRRKNILHRGVSHRTKRINFNTIGSSQVFGDTNNNFMPTTNLREIKHEGKKQKYFSFSFSVSDSARRDAKKK